MLTFPTIHDNGTSRESLAKGYREARDALRVAARRMRETSPNGRDYYPQGPEAMRAAEQEHRSRMQRVDAVIDELRDLLMHCDGE